MLFGNTKIVIYLSSSQIVVGDLREKEPTYFELKYTGDLSAALESVIKKIKSDSYKLILGRDLSYTENWPKPLQLPTRDEVKQDLSKNIPEYFVDEQFDWKIDKQKNIEAIVITGRVFEELKKIKSKYPDIRFESQSVLSLWSEMGESKPSKEIDAALFKYAAKKGNDHGRDDKELNIKLAQPTQKKHKYYIPIVIAILVCVILIVLSIM